MRKKQGRTRELNTMKRRFRNGTMAAALSIASIFPSNVRPESHEQIKHESQVESNDANFDVDIRTGLGYNSMSGMRIFTTAHGDITLSSSIILSMALGIATGEEGIGIEETYLGLSWQTNPGLYINGGVYTSIHLATEEPSPVMWVTIDLPHGWSLSPGYLYWVDGGQHWPNLEVSIDQENLILFIKGGYSYPGRWFARTGASFEDFSVDLNICGERGEITMQSITVSWDL
jgi:hypothetical protein